MAGHRVLKAAAHRKMPWKNGGGETIEVAVHPAGAGLADFDWRVSMARVAGDGPFSVFPGVDRTLCVLDGEGLELEIEGQGRRRLDRSSEPFAFPADAATEGRLLAGPILDLNVMTRRGVLHHRVERVPVGAGEEASVRPQPARWFLLLADGACRIEAAGAATALERHDALLGEGALPAIRVRAVGASVALYAMAIAS